MKKIIYVLIVICSIQNSNLQAAQYENDYNFLKNIKVLTKDNDLITYYEAFGISFEELQEIYSNFLEQLRLMREDNIKFFFRWTNFNGDEYKDESEFAFQLRNFFNPYRREDLFIESDNDLSPVEQFKYHLAKKIENERARCKEVGR